MADFVIDTNVIITFLTTPPNDLERKKSDAVRALFNQIETGAISAILPEIVLHETFYTLLGPRFPDTHLPTLCTVIGGMLQWPGWMFAETELAIYSRALEILEANPTLEFSDSAIVSRTEHHGATLATFDRRMVKAYGGDTWGEP